MVQAASVAEAERAVRGLRTVGFLELEGTCWGTVRSGSRRSSLDELDELLKEGAELIDVRERDERDGGYIAGSRNIPYRLLPVAAPTCPPTGPSSRSARAAPAPHRRLDPGRQGIDARPVLDGGVTAWAARGGQMVEFRRCGS